MYENQLRWAAGMLAVASSLTTELCGQSVDSAYYNATIAVGEKSIRLYDVVEATRWLEPAPAAQRGWEWGYLAASADQSLRQRATMGPPPVSIDLSVSQKLVVTGNTAGTIGLWRLADLSHVRNVGDHEDAVYDVSFSPDGRRLLTVSRDVTSRVYDVDTGAELARIELANPGVAAARFSPDGKLAATCSWQRESDPPQVHGAVWIWDPQTPGSRPCTVACQLSPGGTGPPAARFA